MVLYPKTVFSAPATPTSVWGILWTCSAHLVPSLSAITSNPMLPSCPSSTLICFRPRAFFSYFFFAASAWNMFQPSFYTIYQCTGPRALASISLHAGVCCDISPINHISARLFLRSLFFVAPTYIILQRMSLSQHWKKKKKKKGALA
jgi:hypothetical protein